MATAVSPLQELAQLLGDPHGRAMPGAPGRAVYVHCRGDEHRWWRDFRWALSACPDPRRGELPQCGREHQREHLLLCTDLHGPATAAESATQALQLRSGLEAHRTL